MNKIIPITLSDQSNYEFILDSLCTQSLATFLDCSSLEECSSRRARRYYHMKFTYNYVPRCTASSRRFRRLFSNNWEKEYAFHTALIKIKYLAKNFIEGLKDEIQFSKLDDIDKSKGFREGLKDEFIEMVYDYAVWPIAIIGIVYLYTLI